MDNVRQLVIGGAITIGASILISLFVWIGNQVVMAADLEKALTPLKTEQAQIAEQSARTAESLNVIEQQWIKREIRDVSRAIREMERMRAAGDWSDADDRLLSNYVEDLDELHDQLESFDD